MSSGNSGRVVVITGGARGIGEATARLLATSGSKVVLADIDGDLAEATALDIGHGAVGYHLDVSDRDGFEGFMSMIETDIGELEVLINNAGIAAASPSTIAQDPSLIDRMIAVNLSGVIHGTLAALRHMEPRDRGQVVNIASLAGIAGVRGLPVYAATKFGVVGFTESMRSEYDGTGIGFTCVMPGPVATDMMAGTHRSPMVRLVSPEAVALAISDAIENRRARISVPKSLGLIARLGSQLPPRVAIRLNQAIGVDRVYTEIDESARAEYNARIS